MALRAEPGTSAARTVPGPRASDLAYARLRAMIVDLRLPPGSVLNEQQLATETGFGRMPVREAVARLFGDRFVTVVPRRGTYVTPLGLADVLEMFEAREAIECGVAYLAARRATTEQLRDLRALVDTADQTKSADRIEQHLHADHAIHTRLVEIAANAMLHDAVERLLQHNLRFWHLHWTTHEQRPSSMLSHAELLDALEAHDAEAAERAMRQHVRASRGMLSEAFAH